MRANLDRPDWGTAAGSVTGWAVGFLVVAAVSAVFSVLAAYAVHRPSRTLRRRGSDHGGAPGQRFVWLSRTSNPWLQAVSAVLGLLCRRRPWRCWRGSPTVLRE
ncbi:hypothetical protein LT493_08370 [Streptomyces tricolor]|nr:hypothetical protein [Streptomyces tricolor]